MAEFAIFSTLILIAAPVVLVGATFAAAARKRWSHGADPDRTRRAPGARVTST